MIEELTPKILSIQLLIVVCVTSVLTLIFSVILLWRYRRAVTRLMAQGGSIDTSEIDSTKVTTHDVGRASDNDNRLSDQLSGETLYRQAIRGPWRVALHYAAAGLVFALIYTISAGFVYPHRLVLPGTLLAVWIYYWPVVAALILIVPLSRSRQLAFVSTYFVVFALFILWAGSIKDIPAMSTSAMTLPARSSATPGRMLFLWLVVNGVPTVLMLCCFNHRVRAVAPLMLSFITIVISGVLAVYLTQFSKRGVDITVELAVSLDIDVRWLVLGTFLLALAVFGVIGWLLARVISDTYRHKKTNDQSLMLDALWLLFASWYAMWLILGGLIWTLTAVAAFTSYKLTLVAMRKIMDRPAQPARGLTFLRVFSLGQRSELLLDSVARYWLHLGSVQMITGPDVARSTVQPHQFLDFLSGKLVTHFVHDPDSLARSVAAWDRDPDPDGRFRINNFFCHANTWQDALPRLVEQDDVVLMDLRSFSTTNAGCIHELQHLAENIPLDHCLLIIDDTTDVAFLERTLQQAWLNLSPDSLNKHRTAEEALLYRYDTSSTRLQKIVRRLCACNRRIKPQTPIEKAL